MPSHTESSTPPAAGSAASAPLSLMVGMSAIQSKLADSGVDSTLAGSLNDVTSSTESVFSHDKASSPPAAGSAASAPLSLMSGVSAIQSKADRSCGSSVLPGSLIGATSSNCGSGPVLSHD